MWSGTSGGGGRGGGGGKKKKKKKQESPGTREALGFMNLKTLKKI
jgi:hypothetical protein